MRADVSFVELWKEDCKGIAHVWPRQAWSHAEASSKMLKGKQKTAAPDAKCSPSIILLQAAWLLGLMNSWQL